MKHRSKKKARAPHELRCVCGGAATSRVEAVMMRDAVVLVIGTCDTHAPKDEDQALALVRALLLGIAKVKTPSGRQDARNRGGGHGR